MQQPCTPDDPGIDPDFDALAEPLVGGNRVVAFAAVILIGLLIAGVIGSVTRWLS